MYSKLNYREIGIFDNNYRIKKIIYLYQICVKSHISFLWLVLLLVEGKV